MAELDSCIVCGASGTITAEASHERWTRLACSSCGVKFWHPLEFDASQYGSLAVYKRHGFGRMLMPYHHAAAGVLAEERARAGRPLELLEIGCGNGSFLHLATETAPDLRVSGIDLNPYAVARARLSFGERVIRADAGDDTPLTAGRKYDVICFFEVLEHQTDLDGFMARVRKLLAPGGLVIGSVPNAGRLLPFGKRENFDNPPHHFTWWTEGALVALFERFGFADVAVRQNNPWGPINLSDLYEGHFLGGLKRFLMEKSVSGGKPGPAATEEDKGDYLIKTPLSYVVLHNGLSRFMRRLIFLPVALAIYARLPEGKDRIGRSLVFSARLAPRSSDGATGTSTSGSRPIPPGATACGP